jgi:hypothetical protein
LVASIRASFLRRPDTTLEHCLALVLRSLAKGDERPTGAKR